MRPDAPIQLEEDDDDRPTGQYRRPAVFATPEPAVISVEELAKLLRVNRKTAYEAVARGFIPGVRKIGRTIRIDRQAVLLWLRGQGRVSHSSRRYLR
jgi:excisionase family DNA binding protein